jgi:hypothetical protein
MAKSKKKGKILTFQFSEGWLAHKEGKKLDNNPYQKSPVSLYEKDEWTDGWMGREVYMRSFRRPLL